MQQHDPTHISEVLRHPREVAEATSIKLLQGRYPSLIKYSRGPKAVQKIVPVHGAVQYHPPGWRCAFKTHTNVRYVSASDVSGTFAFKLGLGKGIKPIETLDERGQVLTYNRKEEKQETREDRESKTSIEDDREEEIEAAREDLDEDLELDLLILRSLKVSELRDLCHKAGLPDSGSRLQLMYRIINADEISEDEEPAPKKRKKEEKEKEKEKKEKRREPKDEAKELKEPKELKDRNEVVPVTGQKDQDANSDQPEDELARLEARFAEHEAKTGSAQSAPRIAAEAIGIETEEAKEARKLKEAIEAKRKDLGSTWNFSL